MEESSRVCLGVFADKEQAKEAAKQLARANAPYHVKVSNREN